jgi:hypothetical protein
MSSRGRRRCEVEPQHSHYTSVTVSPSKWTVASGGSGSIIVEGSFVSIFKLLRPARKM